MRPKGAVLASVRIGCAGWSLPRERWAAFADGGSHLERYAGRFDAVEIDTSFYRPHRRETYERWARSTPGDFRFAVKVPKSITHERRLVNAMDALETFLEQLSGLGHKLGCLVVQLPPSLACEAQVLETFAEQLRRRHDGPVALEPRHASWFVPAVDRMLSSFRFARVLADPVPDDRAEAPGGCMDTVYLRLHGSPRMYWSRYEEDLLVRLAERLALARQAGADCWCIFDNTASGASVANALTLQAAVARIAAVGGGAPGRRP